MPNHHEDAEQTALFKWASYKPELRFMFAIPNGGRRNAREAARLKAQGVKSGVYDICLPLARGTYHALYIEMKRRKKDGRSTVSSNQKAFGQAMITEGYKCVVCYGAEEAIDAIQEYLKLPAYDWQLNTRGL